EEINSKYGSDEWVPIHAFFGNDRTRSLAAMQLYDVLLVNPIIDGMNLVAKEGPVVNQSNGVLVLSRTAGAFEQLGKASIPTSPVRNVHSSMHLHYRKSNHPFNPVMQGSACASTRSIRAFACCMTSISVHWIDQACLHIKYTQVSADINNV